AFDIARNIQFAFNPRVTPQIGKNSGDDRYTPYQLIEDHDPTTASILYIRDNTTGHVAHFEAVRVAGNISWSPDIKYLGFEGWSPVRRDTSIFRAFVVVRADGTDRGTVRIKPNTSTYFQWSSDSDYVAGVDGDGVFTVRLADLKVDRRPVQELASMPTWVPHTHYLTWHPTPDSEVILDVDTRAEHSITFPKLDGRGMQDYWSGDANFLAIRQTGAEGQAPIRFFARESDKFREIVPGAITLSSNTYFAQWTPDNQAFITVQGEELIAYYPKDDRYTVLVPGHIADVQTSRNGDRLLIMQRQEPKISIIVVF